MIPHYGRRGFPHLRVSASVSALPSKVFLLFAGGEPDRGDDGRDIASSLVGRFRAGRKYLGNSSVREARWQFPVQQRMCVELVLEMAQRLGRSVKVIDVDWAGDDRGYVTQWRATEALLPLLISPDGRRLEGIESFVPAEVRRFLSQS